MSKAKPVTKIRCHEIPSENTNLIRSRRTNQHLTRTNQKEHFRQVKMNNAFAALRAILPIHPPNKKLSKIEVLRRAICYIGTLQEMVRDCDLLDQMTDHKDNMLYEHSALLLPQHLHPHTNPHQTTMMYGYLPQIAGSGVASSSIMHNEQNIYLVSSSAPDNIIVCHEIIDSNSSIHASMMSDLSGPKVNQPLQSEMNGCERTSACSKADGERELPDATISL